MHEDLERTLRAIEDGVAGLGPEEMAASRDGNWSAEAVLEHLDLTFTSTVTGMAKALDKGPRPVTPTFEQRLAKWMIVYLGHFPAGRKAPEFVVPRGRAGADVLADIRAHLPAMDEAIAAVEARFGAATKLYHARLGPLTGAHWRRFHLVHTRHHMKQIAERRAAASGRG
jgi:hypothetical protein